MTDMTVALRLQVEGAQAWAAAARSARQGIDGVAQASSGSARALEEASAAFGQAGESAEALARSGGAAEKAAQALVRAETKKAQAVLLALRASGEATQEQLAAAQAGLLTARASEAAAQAARAQAEATRQAAGAAQNAAAAARGQAEATTRASRAQKEAASEARSADTIFSRLTEKLKGAAASWAGLAAASFSVGGYIRTADAWSDMSSQIGAAIGDMDGAAASMRRMVEIANASYSPLEQTVSVYAGNVGALRDLGLSAQRAADYTESLNHMLVLTATKGERATSVQDALSKAMAVGKLEADGLETVLAHGGRVAEALAAELGTTVSNLRAFASEGKITGAVIANAVLRPLEEVREAAGKMPATVGDGFTRIQTGVTALIGSFDKAAGVSGGLAERLVGVGDALGGLSVWAEQNGPLLAQAFDVGVNVALAGLVVVAGRGAMALVGMGAAVLTAAAQVRVASGAVATLGAAFRAVAGPLGFFATLAATTLWSVAASAETAEDRLGGVQQATRNLTSIYGQLQSVESRLKSDKEELARRSEAYAQAVHKEGDAAEETASREIAAIRKRIEGHEDLRKALLRDEARNLATAQSAFDRGQAELDARVQQYLNAGNQATIHGRLAVTADPEIALRHNEQLARQREEWDALAAAAAQGAEALRESVLAVSETAEEAGSASGLQKGLLDARDAVVKLEEALREAKAKRDDLLTPHALPEAPEFARPGAGSGGAGGSGGASTRDPAAEAEAARDHARRMLAATKAEGEAARREAEIQELAAEAARRSGLKEDSEGYSRLLAAKAEELRLEDRRKAAEDSRRQATQSAEEKKREGERLSAEALREEEAALKRIAQIDQEAAVAAAALGAARQAATAAATASTLEGLMEIEAEAEAAKRRLAVKDAGQKAYDALDKGATPKQREDARAQAEATEAAKQQAQAEERKLQTAQSLLTLKAEETRASEAAARAQVAAGAAAFASSLADLAAIEERAAASARLAETEERALQARLSLGAEAGKTERDVAEAAARGLAAQEEAARLAGEELDRRREILSLQESAAEAQERGALAERTASAALAADGSAEIARAQARGEAEARGAETERAVKAARDKLGPTASEPERREAETAARAEAAAKEQERLGGVLIAQAQVLADLRERGAQAEARAAVSLRHAAAAAGARSTLELDAARKAAEAETRQLERAEKIRKAGEALGPEADPTRVLEAEALAAAEWDRTDAQRLSAEFVERRAAAIRFEERTTQALADAEAQRAAYLAADGTAEERARAAQLELTVQQRIREAKAAQLDYDEGAIRAAAEREAAAARELDLLQRRGAALEDLERRRRQAEEDAAAARQGPAAQAALSVRRAGEDAARPLGDDPAVAAAAEGEARARLHAEAVKDLQERLRGLQTPYEQALEEADRWREGALAGLDPLAAEHAEYAAEVERIFARLNEDALQHSTDWADGVKRSLKELREANQDWARTSEAFVTGFASSSEEAFVSLAKTGKLEVGSLADFVVEQMARMAYQKAVAPAVNNFAGGIANLIGSFLGGGFGGGTNAASGSVKGFDGGGFTGAGGKYEVAGLVHAGEVVWSQADVARHGGAGLVDAMRRADPLAAASLMMRAAERAGSAGYASGGIVDRAPVFAAPPAAQVEALSRAAAQSPAPAAGPVQITLINQTSQPVQAEARQKADGMLEVRLFEAVSGKIAQDIATGRGPVSGALSGRYAMPRHFGGSR